MKSLVKSLIVIQLLLICSGFWLLIDNQIIEGFFVIWANMLFININIQTLKKI